MSRGIPGVQSVGLWHAPGFTLAPSSETSKLAHSHLPPAQKSVQSMWIFSRTSDPPTFAKGHLWKSCCESGSSAPHVASITFHNSGTCAFKLARSVVKIWENTSLWPMGNKILQKYYLNSKSGISHIRYVIINTTSMGFTFDNGAISTVEPRHRHFSKELVFV